MQRAALGARARGRVFDLLIIGGGIVGASIARDAALRGLAVALIEQGDFAGGTSSKTSKLIHGGLRYLEHGHLGLVAESLRERSILRRTAPTLVHPLSLLLPVYEGDRRPAWQIWLGLWLYDLLAGRRGIRPHRMLSRRQVAALEPGLRTTGLRGAGVFADCQMDDARLCLAAVLQAAGLGAVCLNYTRLREFTRAAGRLSGAAVEDVFTGQMFEIQATLVVNAAGPWADGIRRLSDAAVPPRLAPVKGIHLVLPPVAQEALFIQARRDQRRIFLLPWGDYTLVGTTESDVTQPLDALAAEPGEVGYLLGEVNRILPGAHVGEEDVVATFAGARPLLRHAGTATEASREHRIEVDRWGLVSVLGGKYTTARRMAEQTVDLLMERLGRRERCLTGDLSLIEELHPVALTHWRRLTRAVDPDLLGRFLTRYGAGTFYLLELLARDPGLAQPVCPHHEVARAELVHALDREFACTITDVLARRTRIAWSACQGLDALSVVGELFQRHGGASPAAVEASMAAYKQFLALGRQFRGAAHETWVDEPRPLRPSRRT